MQWLIRHRSLTAICLLTALGIVVVTKTLVATDGSKDLQQVSMIQLIASPRHYNGARVHVEGYLNVEYEANALFLHEEDCRYGMTDNAIRLVLRREQSKQFKALSGKYVMIEGTFVGDDSHSGWFSRHIVDVTKVQELLTKEEFLRRQNNSAKP